MKRSGSGTSNYRRIQRRRYHGRRQNPVPLCSLHCLPHMICFYFFKSSQSHCFPKDFTRKNNHAHRMFTEVGAGFIMRNEFLSCPTSRPHPPGMRYGNEFILRTEIEPHLCKKCSTCFFNIRKNIGIAYKNMNK